jgi:DNA-binding SARP family transcriptional activator
VIKFEVFGAVTAQQDDWRADLTPQQQLMLAALVIAGGKWVAGDVLRRALDRDGVAVSEDGVKRVASELRTRLSPVVSSRAPLSGGKGAYCFPLKPEQADVLRFDQRLAAAELASGDDHIRLLREALAEWGTGGSSLYGGYPLFGLSGPWVEGTRVTLQTKYRNAVLKCVEHDVNCGLYDSAMQECDQLVTDIDAMKDNKFVMFWMLATHLAGQGARALQNYGRARDYTKRHLGREAELNEDVRRLAEQIQRGDPMLSGLTRLPDSPYALVRAPLDLSAAAAAPAPAVQPEGHSIIPHPVSSDPVGSERTSVSEPSITFNIGGTASVGSAIARNEGHVTIHMGAAAEPVAGDAGDIEPNGADCEE